MNNLITGLLLTLSILLYALTLLFMKKLSKYFKSLKDSADDYIISARLTQNWYSVGTSLYVGAVGTWVLTVPIGIGIEYGPWAVLMYAIACSVCWMTYLYFGIKLRQYMKYRGFTVVDFIQERYGKLMYYLILIITTLYLLICITSELITTGIVISSLSPEFPKIIVILAIATFSALYSAIGGFPATMLADRIIGVLTILFVIGCYGSVFGFVTSRVTSTQLAEAFSWRSEGIIPGLTLLSSVMFVELINQGTWQRTIAAKTYTDLRIGILMAVFFMFLSMMIFGLTGCLSFAAKLNNLINYDSSNQENALFLILVQLPKVVVCLAIFMGFFLVISTVTYLQTAIVAVVVSLFNEFHFDEQSLYLGKLLGFFLTIPGAMLAVYQPPKILELFMFANIICAAVVPTILLGFFKYTTQYTAFVAVCISLFSIFVMGCILTGSVQGGLTWGSFPHGYNWECLLTFHVVFWLSFSVCMIEYWILKKYFPHIIEEQTSKLNDILEKNHALEKCIKPSKALLPSESHEKLLFL